VVYHYKPKGLPAFLKMAKRYGFSSGLLLRRYRIFRRIDILPLLAVLLSAIALMNFHLFKPLIILSAITLFTFFGVDYMAAFLAVLFFLSWHGGFFSALFQRNTD